MSGFAEDDVLERTMSDVTENANAAWASSPCFGCGACCRYPRVSFYHGELDSQPGGTVPVDYAVQLTPFRACMKGTEQGNGRCMALGDDLSCAIYEKRSSVCREFPAFLDDGTPNPECARLRAILGIGLPDGR